MKDALFELLDKVAIKYEQYYLFDYSSYRKILYYKLLDSFIERIIQDYEPRNYKYLIKRPITYNMITTILRQICTFHDIQYKIKRQFNHSNTNNDYYIFRVRPEES